jgi:hypothetical protein
MPVKPITKRSTLPLGSVMSMYLLRVFWKLYSVPPEICRETCRQFSPGMLEAVTLMSVSE